MSPSADELIGDKHLKKGTKFVLHREGAQALNQVYGLDGKNDQLQEGDELIFTGLGMFGVPDKFIELSLPKSKEGKLFLKSLNLFSEMIAPNDERVSGKEREQ